MKNNELTFKQDYKNNYLNTSLWLTLAFVLILLDQVLFRPSEQWFYSFFFLFLAWVIIPIAAFVTYNKKKK